MEPRSTRRRFVAALSIASASAVAGCTGSPGSGGDATTDAPTSDATTTEPTTAEPTSEEPTTDDGEGSAADDPTAPVEAFIGADDVETFQSQFHPLHPFSPENLGAENAEALLGNATDPDSLTVERVDQEVTPALVDAATVPGTEVDDAAVADALDGADAAVVSATVTDPEGQTQETRFVTVTHDGEWVILAQGVPTQAEMEAAKLDARVVADVTFDADADTARVHVLENPVADSVTVEAANSGESRSSETPESLTYLDVGMDPDGDEVVVRATVDGESRVVHRERYPESERIVDDVEFVVDPETDDRDAIARVQFNDTDKEGRVRVESTVARGSGEAEPVGSLNYLVVGVDTDGDEVVVTYPVGGDTEAVHRERWFP